MIDYWYVYVIFGYVYLYVIKWGVEVLECSNI